MVRKKGSTKTAEGKKPSRIERKLALTSIQIQSINGQLLLADPPEVAVKLNRQNSLTILEIREKELRIKLSERLSFTPEGPFRLDVEILGSYQYKGKLEESDVIKEIEEIAQPLYSYASLVIGFITERFVSLPIIVAPFKEKDELSETP